MLSLLGNDCDLHCVCCSHNHGEVYLQANTLRREIYLQWRSEMHCSLHPSWPRDTDGGDAHPPCVARAIKTFTFHPSPPLRRAVLSPWTSLSAHTVICTKNVLCPLVALPDFCLPLRSTEDESFDKEQRTWNTGHLACLCPGPYPPPLSPSGLLKV